MVGQITQTLASFWNLFTEIRVPGLGISFSTLYLGFFAVAVSIKLLSPLLGIGGNVANGPVRAGRSIRSERARKRREANTQYVVIRRM